MANWFWLLILNIALVACQDTREDRSLRHLTVDELAAPPPPSIKPKAPPSPAPQPTLAMQKRVSLALTEALPIAQVFWELGRQTGVSLQLDPKIEGKLVFSAQNRPLLEVIDHLCALNDLRYRIIGPAIRIEADTPYAHNYNIQFLNSARSTQNQISIATDVFATNGGGGKTTADNGSNSTVNATSTNDFWAELENNLKIILSNDKEQDSNYALHRQGGLIAVFATQRQHKL
ncbi:MAG: hypothetical protein WCG04_03125 [Alphaproteobacteria bacterium]